MTAAKLLIISLLYGSAISQPAAEDCYQSASILETCENWISDQIPEHWNEEIRVGIDGHSMLIVGRLWQKEASALLFKIVPVVGTTHDGAASPQCEQWIEINRISTTGELGSLFDSGRSLEFPLQARSFSDHTNGNGPAPRWSLEIKLINTSYKATWEGCGDETKNSTAGWALQLVQALTSELNPCDVATSPESDE